jgi:trehalose/maltose transport system permease protein
MTVLRSWAARAGLLIAIVLVMGWSLGPFAWFAVTSMKSPLEIAERPPRLLPQGIHVENYARLVTYHHMGWPVRNSAVVAGLTTLVTIPVAALAAYALSRLAFWGRSAVLAGVLAASMFPQITLAYTIERWLYALGWINTYQGLVVPYISLTLPLAVWILASFFREIPVELEDAARVDGCGRLGTLVRIFLPVAAPAIFTAAILTFIYAWNEFFFASFITDREEVRTLPVAIAQFHGRYSLPWGELAAASIVATLPLVVVVLALQRRIIQGLTAGAVKG